MKVAGCTGNHKWGFTVRKNRMKGGRTGAKKSHEMGNFLREVDIVTDIMRDVFGLCFRDRNECLMVFE
jgi:hypothetical protein